MHDLAVHIQELSTLNTLFWLCFISPFLMDNDPFFVQRQLHSNCELPYSYP